MAFSLRSLSRKHIPTLLGLGVLIAGLVGGVVFIQTSNTNSFLPRASPQTIPKNIKITNVTDSQFTVSWVSDSSTIGFVKYGTTTSSLSKTANDDRDQASGTTGMFQTHHVTVRSLSASTTYYFKIGTGTQELYDNSGVPYTVSTTTSVSSQARTMYGEVDMSDGSPANGALIYISADNLAPISALVQSSGSYVISLAQARTTDLANAAQLDPTTPLNILVISPTGDTTSLVTTNLTQSQPVPQITLGVNADFTASSTPAPLTGGVATTVPTSAPATAAIQSKFTSQLLAPPTEVTNTQTLTITNPQNDGDLITSNKPELRGNAPSGTKVTLSLKGPFTQTMTMTVDPSGIWTWTPASKLSNAPYTLTATNGTGTTKQTATRSFTVDTTQVGVIPAITATQSATLTPTPVPTPTATPPFVPLPTSSAVAIATQSSTPIISHPSTASGQLVTGNTTPTLFLMVVGIVSLLAGTILWTL
ncbi:hypothetical protein C5B42_02225 [Candidatus Cerribacteria bacterium 'Amazon FNV 2010 28 9']|uniref:Fibronectin type-III domain-containing protein n=1 Tax=Candidatus Cerribacteria bacterium 'Amazon FNV 2010 28 9' TaxID=2081795 RepID=A0A317JRU4_9BACT|nr:MAG: hypothetical protein C5B42_02225 [Candidatus Cerribacteria bacterium 'Amazon FNV 2010 28 9']